MTQLKKSNTQLVVLLTYVIMLAINALANILPINGITTGEVSDSFYNLFAPAPITFAIWGVIYALLLLYSIYIIIQKNKMGEVSKALTSKINGYFIIINVVNSIWIIAWHFKSMLITLILMIVILICLIIINLMLRKKVLGLRDTLIIKMPFTIYLGWITIATIANVVTYLVSINWDGFGLSNVIWMNIMVLVGLLVGFIAMNFYKSISYGLVIIWAYVGILIKHLSLTGFNGQFKSVISITAVAVAVLVIGEFILIRKRLPYKKSK